jgi:hypothetical protein
MVPSGTFFLIFAKFQPTVCPLSHKQGGMTAQRMNTSSKGDIMANGMNNIKANGNKFLVEGDISEKVFGQTLHLTGVECIEVANESMNFNAGLAVLCESRDRNGREG